MKPRQLIGPAAAPQFLSHMNERLCGIGFPKVGLLHYLITKFWN
jgi:hypothetical protein